MTTPTRTRDGQPRRRAQRVLRSTSRTGRTGYPRRYDDRRRFHHVRRVPDAAGRVSRDPGHHVPGRRQDDDAAKTPSRTTAAGRGRDGGAASTRRRRRAAEPRPQRRTARRAAARRRNPTTTLADIDEFVEFFITAGKKGVAINRYKGLGEMNPDTLWKTTMDPGATGRCCRCAPRTTPRRTRCSRR